MSKKKVIAILTNFMEFNEGYSLTGIVKDQVRMLKRAGHEVRLFVNSKYHGVGDLGVEPELLIPFAHLKDYTSETHVTTEGEDGHNHTKTKDDTAAMLAQELKEVDIVFTHDFAFTGWFLPYGLGVRKATKDLPHVRWMHWVHSVPSVNRDWWNMRNYTNAHKLIFPNETDRLRVAEQYQGTIDDVRVIPHIKDLRSWFDFHPDTCEFLDTFPGVMRADVVQVYPASTDRLSAKRVDKVIMIMKALKNMGASVCLVVPNQWATGRQRKEDVDRFYLIASRNGLKRDEEFIFTSEWKPSEENALPDWHYETGVPRHMVRELMQCSNLFVFPTREESFGLVLPEAALAGGVLCVLNKSLQMQLEISGHTGVYFDFGSFHNTTNHPDEAKFLRDVAAIIRGRMSQSEAIKTKTFMRQRYNFDYLYDNYYAPVMAESAMW